MKLDKECDRILEKAQNDEPITFEEAETLMNIDLHSKEMYALCAVADNMSRRHFNNIGEAYLQIGLESAPCKGNCVFCVFAAKNGFIRERTKYSKEEVVRKTLEAEKDKPSGIVLMITCTYDFEEFLEVGNAVYNSVSHDIPIVANIPDFNYSQAMQLVDAGFSAIFHVVRINEGIDTTFSVEQRIATVEAAKQAGLAIQACVDPLGIEHTVKQQVENMFLQKELGYYFSGVSIRIPVPKSPLAHYGQVPYWYAARTTAVSRLVMGTTVTGHCVHETNIPCLLAGANVIWAEVGSNPRDANKETEKGRGFSIKKSQEILRETGWDIRVGPSPTSMGPAWFRRKQAEGLT